MTPWTAAHQASLSFTISRYLFKLMSIEFVLHLTISFSVTPFSSCIFSSIRVFVNKLTLPIRWPKYWRISCNIRLSNEYSGLISFMIDWLILLAVQGTLKSLLQLRNLKASIFQCSASFIVQFSHPYMSTGKTIAWTIWTIVSKVVSLVFNMLLGLS